MNFPLCISFLHVWVELTSYVFPPEFPSGAKNDKVPQCLWLLTGGRNSTIHSWVGRSPSMGRTQQIRGS